MRRDTIRGPAEVLRALLAEEVAGRDRSALATRCARAAFPTGKTFLFEALGQASAKPAGTSPGSASSSSAY